MQQQFSLSRRAFFAGLLLMLGTGILSATIWTGGGYAMPLLMLTGALVALGARLWHHRLRRAARQGNTMPDLGGYPLDLLRDPRFTSRGRVA